MPIYYGASQITSVKKAAADLSSLLVPSLANPGQLVEMLLAPPSQVTGLAVDSTGDGTIDLSWTSPASDATITDYSVEYTDVQPLTGVALLAPYDSDLDDVLGITATATNTPTVTSGGQFGSYADLGAADKLAYSSVPFGSSDYTVEFWVKRTESSWAPNTGNPLLELPGVAMLGRAGTDTLQLYEDDFGSWAAVSGTTTSSVDQDWHHIALVRDGSTLRFYLDGSQVGTMSTSASPSSLELGASSIYGCRFGVDDLRVSTSAVYPGGTTFTPPTTAHPTSGGGTAATVLVGSAATTYQLTGLTNDTQYSVRVAAVSAAGTGTYSTAATGTPSSVVAGALYSWGSRYGTGQLGTDADWTSLGGGENWSFAVKSSGLLHAWGENSQGNLGDGTTTARSFSVQIGSDQWSMLARGGLYHSLGIKSDGTLWAWGNGGNGRLGLGSTTTYNTPQQVGSATWDFVAAGESCSYAIKSDGTLHSWGFGAYGQLGLGSTSSPTTPQQVGSATWSAVAGGENFSAAIKSDGTLWTVGYSSDGQLGDGSSSNRTTFSQVGSATWSSVTCGRYHGLAIKSDGTLWAWGNNAGGQLGLGSFTNQNTLQQVGSANWSRIHSFGFDTIGVRSDGTLWHWGNSSGQSSPVQVGSSTGYFDAQVGSSYEIALRS